MPTERMSPEGFSSATETGRKRKPFMLHPPHTDRQTGSDDTTHPNLNTPVSACVLGTTCDRLWIEGICTNTVVSNKSLHPADFSDWSRLFISRQTTVSSLALAP